MSRSHPDQLDHLRLSSLDGLRGLAALIVVIFHGMIVAPVFADALQGGHVGPGWSSVFVYSPLRLLWAGEEAVTVFFVLSGFVLALPFRNRTFDWMAYYPRRLVRLYVPVWASVVLALMWYVAVPRHSAATYSWWMNGHDADLSLRRMGADLTLVFGTTWLNSPLWSLKWEIWFSLLLPAYLLLFLRWRGAVAAKIIGLLGALGLGYAFPALEPLKYLPIFGLGVLLAAHLDTIGPRAQALRTRTGIVLLVGSLALLDARWLTGDRVDLPVLAPLGATMLVLLGARWAPMVRFCEQRGLQWLGRVSFSLYLVHEPILVSAALVLRTTNPLAVLAVALPLSLLAAAGFHRAVERPSQRWASSLGRLLQNRRRPTVTERVGG